MSEVPLAPPTPQDDVVDVLHDVPVSDPYRWLEDGEADEVRAWTTAQNERARIVLDALPQRRALKARMVELLSVPTVAAPAVAGERMFTVERGGTVEGSGTDQAVLVLRSTAGGPDDPGRMILDPQALLGDETAALDWYHPSRDGGLVAFGTSLGGDERSVLQVLDVAAGGLLDDRIENTRAASVAWAPDGSGFAYTRYPAGGEVGPEDLNYHRQVYWHRLGDPVAADVLLFGPLADKTAWTDVSLSADGRWLLVHLSIGWDRTDVFLRDRSPGEHPWVTVIEGVDALSSFRVDRHRLLGVTTLDSPRGRVVEAALAAPAEWSTLVPEGEAVIEMATVTPRSLLVLSTRTAVSQLTRHALDGSAPTEIRLPGAGSIGGISASRDRDEVWFSFTSFIRPEQLFRWTGASAEEPEARPWSPEAPSVDPDRFVVEEHRYPSTDGTSIHLFLVGPPGGPVTRPTVLTGYGGFGITMGPAFSPLAVAVAEAGGRCAVANIRGGSEEGEEWHQAGQRRHKQQVFDDFCAAADWLVAEGLSATDRLAIRGGSNGGLLVAAAITQRPDLCRAVHCAVPLTDMVRFPRFLIAKLWVPEFGDPEVPEEFAWLHAYSPYHHVEDGTCYPAVLVTTGESDSRVDPCHARKLAARLQAATACPDRHPVLLRLEERAGHGQGKPIGRQAEELADVAAFLWWQLEI